MNLVWDAAHHVELLLMALAELFPRKVALEAWRRLNSMRETLPRLMCRLRLRLKLGWSLSLELGLTLRLLCWFDVFHKLSFLVRKNYFRLNNWDTLRRESV